MDAMKFFKIKRKSKDHNKTGWAISGLGLLVSTIGAKMLRKKVGAGILGFGLAHILLGQLDRLRPTVKSW